MTGVVVRLLRLPHGEGLPLPAYHSAHAAGLDVVAGVPADASVALAPGGRALIPTGFALELPAGYEAQLRPRSGLPAASRCASSAPPSTAARRAARAASALRGNLPLDHACAGMTKV